MEKYLTEEWREVIKQMVWADCFKDQPDTQGYIDFIEKLLEVREDKAREEGRREVYEAIVFDENIPHDITTFVAANLWKNMRDKAKEELSKLKQ